ncbi:MAG: glycosyltransferase [Planctomycetaceae bacterium]|nr:glycosyltransferase [Planctomycetaceae bacterium]
MKSLGTAMFGSSLVSAYWNGAATYYRGIIKALNQYGHRTTFYESDALDRQQHRDIPDPSWARVVVYSSVDESAVRRCLDEARSADVIIKASGVGAFDDLLEAAVPDLRTTAMKIFWDVDAPATLDRLEADGDDPFATLIGRYDLILTYGGGEPVARAYRRWGARRCAAIYNGVDLQTHHPTQRQQQYAADLSFIGNRLPDREARVEEFFLRPAAMLPQRTFLIGGSGWHDKPMPTNVRRLAHVYTRDHNAVNCSATAVLNISRQSMAAYGYSPATRVFEAAGAAACLISDDWEGIDHFFEPGKEILVARDGQEVAQWVESLTPEAARQIGNAALERVRAQHTYQHRAAVLDKLLRGAAATASPVHA